MKTKSHWIAALSGLVLMIAILACSIPLTGREPTQEVGETRQPKLIQQEATSPTQETAAMETPIHPTETPVPTLGVGSTRENPTDGAIMVYVPEGPFLMGSKDGKADERPNRQVVLDAFWLYQTEVTNTQFAIFVAATAHSTSAEESGESRVFFDDIRGAYWAAPEGPESDLVGREAYPVLHVSWFDADAYCSWAGGRLPTEAQWEKGARGTDGREFPWGNSLGTAEIVNFCDSNCPANWANAAQDDGYGMAAPVGTYPAGASPYGALDMAGNVWEWLADWYDENYYSYAPLENPTGPESGTFRVFRGGSWMETPATLRVPARARVLPISHSSNLGFRCVVMATP
jgi:eukaryotic-like serine/threonine-protein kinase